MQTINSIQKYTSSIFGFEIQVDPLGKKDLQDLPMYIRESYLFYRTILFEKTLIILELKELEGIKISLISANVELVKERMGYPVVILLNSCTALQRSRLIDKGINFIVPGLQFFLPELLMDLREVYKTTSRSGKELRLRPSAQFLLIFHLINSEPDYQLVQYNFKMVSAMTGYSPMAITLAAENLEELGLINTIGTKDKYINFCYEKKELWEKVLASGLVRNPVRSRVFVDNKPGGIQLLNCNISALPDYSDLSPANQEYYAIDNNDFRILEERNDLENANKDEGRFCLEIWKYNPRRIWGDSLKNHRSVDPLSLYLSMQDSPDERVEIALEQLILEYQW